MINTVSITDLKKNTASIVKKVKISSEPLVVLQRSKPSVVLIDPEYYKILEGALEDLIDLKAIEERKNEPTVPFETVAKKLGLR